MAPQNPLLHVNHPSTDTMSTPTADTMSTPTADTITDHEGVRRIMKGIARSHGRAQKQAKPLTAEALPAVRATANTRRPLRDGRKKDSAQRAS